MDSDFPLLATVAAEPVHPFGLLKHLRSIGQSASRSTLYRRIDALVDSGELAARDERGPDGRVRRMLSLKKKGAARLKKESARVLEREPLASPLFALALSSAEALQDITLTELLRARMSAAARTLTRTEGTLNKLSGDSGFWVRTSHEREVAHMKADLQWLQSVMRRKQIEAPPEIQLSQKAG